MQRLASLILALAHVAFAQHQSDDDLSKAFDPPKELKFFEPEHNVPPPPPIDDPDAKVRATFEADFETAKKALDSGDAAAARDQLTLLELSAFVLGGPERIRVNQLQRAAAASASERKALDTKWLIACGPNDVATCRAEALEAIATYDRSRADAVRAADACLTTAEKSPGKPAPACLKAALALYTKAEDTLMIARVELVNALALGKAGKKSLTRLAECVDGRNGHVRQAAFDARAKLELADGNLKEAAKLALLGAEAFATTLPLEERYWARTQAVDEICAAYDKEKGPDACRQLEKQYVGSYVFFDFSKEHLADRQLISHQKLVQVNEHYSILIKDCLALEIREIADKAQVSYLVNWLVLQNGRVDNFHSLSSAQDQSRFVTCLREQFGYWRYPSHEGEPQRIKQGFSVKSTMRATEETEPE
ncbi:MAG: hypothetical protein ACO1OB_22945 [Archangium sp.]